MSTTEANCLPAPNPTHISNHCKNDEMFLNAYTVTRIVYEVIKLYFINNNPNECGVRLDQTYDPDYKKSQILLDISYNWKTKDMSKVPAVFIMRGDVSIKNPTLGQLLDVNIKQGAETRFCWNSLMVNVMCVAAEPLAVVENLAEFVKQPLLYYRKEIQQDFHIRQFKLIGIDPPKLLQEGKNNFFVNLNLSITFDEGWTIKRDSLKIGGIGVALFDMMMNPLQTIDV
jgi:hypothetical protein